MPDTPEPAVLHARLPDGQGGFRGPRIPRLHPAGQLRPTPRPEGTG